VQFQCIPAFNTASQARLPDWLRTQRPWTVRFGASRCKSWRPLLVLRADFACDNWVQAISSAAKAGIPERMGPARSYASALRPSVADP
jgi:hypothetical protein